MISFEHFDKHIIFKHSITTIFFFARLNNFILFYFQRTKEVTKTKRSRRKNKEQMKMQRMLTAKILKLIKQITAVLRQDNSAHQPMMTGNQKRIMLRIFVLNLNTMQHIDNL